MTDSEQGVLWATSNILGFLCDVHHLAHSFCRGSQHRDDDHRTFLRWSVWKRISVRGWRDCWRHVQSRTTAAADVDIYGVSLHWALVGAPYWRLYQPVHDGMCNSLLDFTMPQSWSSVLKRTCLAPPGSEFFDRVQTNFDVVEMDVLRPPDMVSSKSWHDHAFRSGNIPSYTASKQSAQASKGDWRRQV